MTSGPAPELHLREQARLRRVRARIDREYQNPLDVDALPHDAHMSAGHLSRQFRLAYGDPPCQVVTGPPSFEARAGAQPGHRFPAPGGSRGTRTDTMERPFEFRRASREPPGYWTPDLGASKLPVMVWIHGGGFVSGSSASSWYDGSTFARDGVVVVSINYRLGIDGFLAVDGAPLNRGVHDWLAALRWVRDNVSAFGGDPDRVTIAGQSAGGTAAITLMTIESARGLFAHVICASGAIGMVVDADTARAAALNFAHRVGIEPTAEDLLRVPTEQLMAALRQNGPSLAVAEDPRLVLASLTRAQVPLRPVVDGELIEREPLSAIHDGASTDVDILVTTTAHEFNSAFSRPEVQLDEAQLSEAHRALDLTADRIAAYRRLYPTAGPEKLVGQAWTDRLFRVGAGLLIEARTEATARTFAAELIWTSRTKEFGAELGAAHCLDIPFAFDVLEAEGVARATGPHPPKQLADLIHGAWARFITSGHAGWSTATEFDRPTLEFTTGLPRLRSRYLQSELEIWAKPRLKLAHTSPLG